MEQASSATGLDAASRERAKPAQSLADRSLVVIATCRSWPLRWRRHTSHLSAPDLMTGVGGIFPSPKIGDGGGLTVISGPFLNFAAANGQKVEKTFSGALAHVDGFP